MASNEWHILAISPVICATEVAGEQIPRILTTAPGNGSPIGGIKVIIEGGGSAASSSGAEGIYKIYAAELRRAGPTRQLEDEAQTIVSETLARSARAA